MKKWIATVLVLALSACMTVEMPKNMVKDVADLGKETYRSLRGQDKNPPAKSPSIEPSNLVSYTMVAGQDLSLAQARQQCREMLLNKARMQFVNLDADSPGVPEQLQMTDNGFMLRCGILARNKS